MIYAGYFDYIIIVILILFNIIFWKKKIKENIGCTTIFILFGLVLPIISQIIEIKQVQYSRGIMDNFEVLYTIFRFPLYWLIGIIQGFILKLKK